MLKSTLALLAMVGAIAAFVAIANSAPSTTTTTTTTTSGVSAARFDRVHKKLRAMRHIAYVRLVRGKQLKRVLLHREDVREAINLACTIYGNCPTLWRKAKCETGGTFDPRARYDSSADSAMGLFEFKPSTFAGTPFARFNIFSPYASALAAGWMHVHGRGGEWVCK